MSNKSNGTAFEKDFARILSEHGFWVHRMKDNENGQPFDVIAAKDGNTYVFDCKDCQGDGFLLSRIEDNQHNAMTLWTDTGNLPGLFAIRMPERTYLVPHRMLIILRENGTRKIGYEQLSRIGRSLNEWLQKREKRVIKCR